MSRSASRVTEGSPYRLGATADADGVNFAVFSAHASAIEISLFDSTGTREQQRITLPEFTDEVWHGHIADVRPGDLYGLRVSGPYDPWAGHRFDATKLLIDPYAYALKGALIWHDALFSEVRDDGHSGSTSAVLNSLDSAPYMPKCIVPRAVHASSPDAARKAARVPWPGTIIYEAHVKGLTASHPGIAPELRGTFAALTDPVLISHLRALGITTLELMPVQAFVDEQALVAKGLTNYWGYNSLAFFAPHMAYLSTADRGEIRHAVDTLHEAGIEVVLDVVFNHTAEGNHLGPTLSFKGIDNASYYRLEDDKRFYADTTGCGNALDTSHPRVIELVAAALRHWIGEYGVDGFRFDLATSLARTRQGFDETGAFLTALRQDPQISRAKLIAEPWDIGHDGYQLGGFPPGFGEWNDRFRDGVRSFWRGDRGSLPAMASALLGSATYFDRRGRRPYASVNFITAHDGFTLADLVSFDAKHNEANGEHNRDGHNDNLSWNCGIEGPTDDIAIEDLRDRMRRNLMATLLAAQGTPMLLMGDERGRSQSGNNNAYCQDNSLSWMSWSTHPREQRFQSFVRGLVELRRRTPHLRQPRFLHGNAVARGVLDVTWLRLDGEEMTMDDWLDEANLAVALMLATGTDCETLMLILNAASKHATMMLPEPPAPAAWQVRIDTARGVIDPCESAIPAGSAIALPQRSMLVLSATREPS